MRKLNDQINAVLSGADHLGPSYAMLNAMLHEAHKVKRAADAKLTPEERAARKQQRELAEIKRLRKALVVSGNCPECEGKLIRGKKSKKHNHQRLWKCQACSHQFTWEGDKI